MGKQIQALGMWLVGGLSLALKGAALVERTFMRFAKVAIKPSPSSHTSLPPHDIASCMIYTSSRDSPLATDTTQQEVLQSVDSVETSGVLSHA
jgi:hypothetical protein